MALECTLFHVIFQSGMGMCRPLSSSILFVWMAPFTLVIMTLRGSTCHPYVLITSISGWYLSYLVLVAC